MHSIIGRTITDSITGFRGVVTGRVEYLTGCNQVLVQPRCGDDGKMVESAWFDEQRVSVVEDVATVSLDNGNTPGADRPAPRR